MGSIENPHDKIFKELISKPEIAADLIRGLCPVPIVSLLDFSSCTHETGSYIDSFLVESYSDLVYTVNYKGNSTQLDGRRVKIALLLEHKSFKPKNEFLQLLRYMLNIWEVAQKDGRNLEPVVPIIVYHGKGRWQARDFKSVVEGIDNALLPYFPNFEYLLANIGIHTDTALREQLFEQNANKLLTLLYKNHQDTAYLAKNVASLFELIRDDLESHADVAISMLLYFAAITEMGYTEIIDEIHKVSAQGGKTAMTAYQQLINKGINQGLSEGLTQGLSQGLTQGLSQGLTQGQDLGKREVAQNLIKKGVNIQIIIESTGLSADEIQKMQKQLSV